jgi:hypothetical protein
MKKNLQFIFILLNSLFLSCKSEIPKEKLTTIDNFVLGQSSANLSKQMDSLSIFHKRFLTKEIIREYKELQDDNNYLNMYYTNTFDLSDYRSRYHENVSLLYPMTLAGTKNIIGIIVIFGHTTHPLLLGDVKPLDVIYSEKVFKQDINARMIEDIKNLYISKYGPPSDTFSILSHRFYYIQGNQIITTGDPDRKGLDITWKTEYYTITFFTGLPSYDSRYLSSDRTYQDVLTIGSKMILPVNYLKNEVQDFSYCYIEYHLNDKAIKELKLDNINL